MDAKIDMLQRTAMLNEYAPPRPTQQALDQEDVDDMMEVDEVETSLASNSSATSLVGR